jgi:nucleoid-associated protein YgaU
MYVVAPHDNFWKISKKQYGSVRYFMALTRHNQALISDPTHMKPGMRISTPSREVLESQYPDLIEGLAARSPAGSGFARDAGAAPASELRPGFFMGPGGEPMYRVGHDDTLTSISQKHLGRASRWVEIVDQNHELQAAPDSLKIGAEIRLPPDASRLGLVGPSVERR